MAPDQRIERLARAMTSGDPDRPVPISYGMVVGYNEGAPAKSVRQTDVVPAWKFRAAEARAALAKADGGI